MRFIKKLKPWLLKAGSFAGVVLVPLAILVIYYGLIASDRYTSEAYFTIKESNSSGGQMDFGLLGMSVPSSFEDQKIMEEYLLSDDLLRQLDDELALRAHYQNGGADLFSRLAGDATREEFLEYYRSHIDVYFDESSGLLSVEVQAFDRDFAKKLLETMLKKAETFVNDISHQLAVAQLRFVEEQLVTKQANLKHAKQSLLTFQNKNHIYSPEQEGQALTAILDSLEGELIKERANLKQLRSFQNATAPQVTSTRKRIQALSDQIAQEKTRLIGEGGQKINDLLAEYTDYQLEFEFAKDAYASTLAALEQSRAEASKKMKHLVVVSRPSLAEEAKYPNRTYILVTALIILMMLFGIIRMVIATVREHQD